MRARRFRWLAALSLSLGLSACGDEVPFDPVALSQVTGEVVGAIDNSPASQSLAVLGPKMTVAAPPLVAATMPGADLLGPSSHRWVRERMEALERAAGALSPGAGTAIFPVDVLGKTFTYNPQTGKYQLSNETGAPATGVRFVLYAVNATTQQVVIPLDPIGYLELTDESTPSAVALGIKAVVENVTLLDYDARVIIATTSLSFAAVGFISDGTTQVDFDLTQSFAQTTGFSIDYTVEVPEKGVGLHLEATFNLDLVGSIKLTIEHEGNTTAIQVSGSLDGPITGSITHNGEVVVNISGTEANPVFTKTSGEQLTAQEQEALENLADAIGGIFEAFDDLLGPAYHLLDFPSPA